jgi:hypothetical protein
VGNGEAIEDHSLLDADRTGWDHQAQGLFDSTILAFSSFKRNLHCLVCIAAQAKAELVFLEFNLSDSEVPANCTMMTLNIYPPAVGRLKVPLE